MTPIEGLSFNVIINDQLFIASTDDEYISSGALAFMKGIYTPTADTVLSLSNGSTYNRNDTLDLRIRFLYQNGTTTSDGDALISYPLFGRGNSEADMTWSDFVEGMTDLALNRVGDWCLLYQTENMFYTVLWSVENTTNTATSVASSKKFMNPAVAGAIGTIVTLVLMLLVIELLALCSFRMRKREKAGSAGGLGVLKLSGSGKGFKDAEKLSSVTDLYLQGGAGATVIKHERVGS
ncbi:hypothetical protein BJ878DRAFT_566571 [Calycina marina]|uniref:Uncharacterized protein n=1 Tax=Calycina marina TaxID=1763456 RepID=A0A9P8CFW4_9HELO|nr:hypothetical protein BJ878DRAFT_566571 [Calycina marina]